ncbi:MAG: hypothetical protein LQ352_004374 [Teloschistes flavicans]|nr:MAG: hypothetical protein LQ352_004374 [Teloschistes flavicans]
MPNRYSHASVISHYESRGLISRPARSPSIPSSSASLLCLDLNDAYDADNMVTRPLTAVPHPYDASARSINSTASSLEDNPPKPLHSASSSILTEIHAPGCAVQSPIIESAIPTETTAEYSKSIEHSKSPNLAAGEKPASENLYNQRSSRYSSAPKFAALFNLSLPSTTNKVAHDDRRVRTPQEPMGSTQHPTVPRNTSIRIRNAPKSMNHPPVQHYRVPYKRIQPTFSIESLPPLETLSFGNENTEERPPSPNAEILPWEHRENGMPYLHQPPELPNEQGSAEREERDSGYQSLDGQTPETNPTPKFHPVNYVSSSQQPAASPLPFSFAHDVPQILPHALTDLSFIPSTATIASETSQYNLSRSRSIDSFDSAAPPPIRLHPGRQSPSNPLGNMKIKKGYAHSAAYSERLNRAGGGSRGDDWVRTGKRR